MPRSHLPHDEPAPDPAGVDAGPQGDAGGGEPKGAQLKPRDNA